MYNWLHSDIFRIYRSLYSLLRGPGGLVFPGFVATDLSFFIGGAWCIKDSFCVNSWSFGNRCFCLSLCWQILCS
jgi:hypothetical protein